MTQTVTAPQTISFWLPGRVAPKARPRINKKQAYLPSSYREWKRSAVLEILYRVQESSGAAHYFIDRSAQVWQEQDKFDLWIDPWICLGEQDHRSTEEPPSVADVVARFEKLQEPAEQRIHKIDKTLSELE